MRTTIETNSGNTLYGERNSPFRCPMALAFRDAGFEFPAVHGDEVHFFTKSDRGYGLHSGKLPDSAKKFIKLFDNGAEVEPITFDLEYLRIFSNFEDD